MQQEKKMHKNKLELLALKLTHRVTSYSDKQYSLDLLSENGLYFQTSLGAAIKEKSNCAGRVSSSVLKNHADIESCRKTDC